GAQARGAAEAGRRAHPEARPGAGPEIRIADGSDHQSVPPRAAAPSGESHRPILSLAFRRRGAAKPAVLLDQKNPAITPRAAKQTVCFGIPADQEWTRPSPGGRGGGRTNSPIKGNNGYSRRSNSQREDGAGTRTDPQVQRRQPRGLRPAGVPLPRPRLSSGPRDPWEPLGERGRR